MQPTLTASYFSDRKHGTHLLTAPEFRLSEMTDEQT